MQQRTTDFPAFCVRDTLCRMVIDDEEFTDSVNVTVE
jgi:hypothetical protein